MGDLPIKELGGETPLGAADTPNMDSLAKTGKTGLMYTVSKGIAPESDVGVISILGYDPFAYETGRGILEAVGAGIPVKDGDLALRCNFATLGKRKQIIDRRAGRDLTAEEASELSQSINEHITLESYPANFDFISTIGHRAVLVIRSEANPLSDKITNTDPAYTKIGGIGVAESNARMLLKKCRPMDKSNAAKASAALVNEFVQKSYAILGSHETNKRREAKGELKANVILTRDAGCSLPNLFKINERYRVRFACLADMPVERGIAKLAGMSLIDLPPPSKNLKDDSLLRVRKLLEILPLYDCVYIHIKNPDEPGHDGNFRLKKHLIELIDEHFFGELLQRINLSEFLICITADHSTPCALRAHSDDPVPVLISGDRMRGDNVSKFSENECLKGSLGILQKGTQLMPMLMGFLKAKEPCQSDNG
jgi:2,3-bisphosphoglycerate-independent phosphoglycerate mutase